jgi:DNA-directed RNA polymerase specialized sigma24 family protein
MKDSADRLAHVENKLDTLIRLFAIASIKDLETVKEKALLLNRAGLGPKEIAQLCDTTPNTINVALSNARREAKG